MLFEMVIWRTQLVEATIKELVIARKISILKKSKRQSEIRKRV